MADGLTVRVSSYYMVTYSYSPDRAKSVSGFMTILDKKVMDWLNEMTPTATQDPQYDHTIVTFTSMEDMVMFKLAFSDNL